MEGGELSADNTSEYVDALGCGGEGITVLGVELTWLNGGNAPVLLPGMISFSHSLQKNVYQVVDEG